MLFRSLLEAEAVKGSLGLGLGLGCLLLLRDDLRLLLAEAHVIGGDALVGGGLGQRGLLLALAQLQVEELAVLLDVVQPFGFQIAEIAKRKGSIRTERTERASNHEAFTQNCIL